MAKHSRAASHARRAIAAKAARLMAEDGLTDFGTAKRKAARHLGFGESDDLPDNAEIEEALRTYQALYQNDEQRARLGDLRQIALSLMESLAPYRPALSGAVWHGTATRGAGIDIDLFTDDAKALEMSLLNRGIVYSVSRRPHFAKSLRVHIQVLRFDADDVAIALSVYSLADERDAFKRDALGQAARGAIREVAALIAAADNAGTVERFLAAIR